MEGGNGVCYGLGGADGGDVGEASVEGVAADGVGVEDGLFADGGVDDEVDVHVDDAVDDVGAAFGHFEDEFGGDVIVDEGDAGTLGGEDFEAHAVELSGEGDGALFVGVFDGEEDGAFGGQGVSGGELGFGVGDADIVGDTHDFAGGEHFGAEEGIDAGEFEEGEDGLLDGDVVGDDFVCKAELCEGFSGHDFRSEFGEGHADGFADEGDGSGGTGVDFEDEDIAVFDGVLDVDEAFDVQFEGESAGLVFDLFEEVGREGDGGQGAGGVAGVDAGFFDVFHDAADDDVLAVADGVDVEFDSVAEEFVDEDGVVG